MPFYRMRTLLLTLLATNIASAQRPTLSAAVRQFVVVDTSVLVIRNVRVIDGTGAAPRENQTLVIRDGRIASVGPTTQSLPPTTYSIDGTGKTILPGLVLVHEHLFYPTAERATYFTHPFTFPRLYLGSGITTARTGGNMQGYADINVRKMIDAGQIPGPKFDITAPYLNGENQFPQMYALKDAADARRFVNYWADMGATSFKAYMQISRDQLRAAVEEAHKRGLKVTGHLCSVTYREAAEIGIDNLEHGFYASTDFVAGKRPDTCPNAGATLASIDPATDTVAGSIIRTLVDRKVALTSTLTVFEASTPGRPAPAQRILEAMSNDARVRFLSRWANSAASGDASSPRARGFKNGMTLLKRFADAGGTIVVGTDPTGNGGVIPGLSSQREVILLAEAGFTPLEAIKAATLNGATYLGRAERVGSIAVGKDADLVLIAGNPAANIADIEKVELVFKDGVAYDSAKLINSAKGAVGGQ
jgi:imidazolonepropionase-like amidohydrolase